MTSDSPVRPPGRPGKALKAAVGTWTPAHSEKLLQAVLMALIQGRKRVTLRTHYCMDFPPGFPKAGHGLVSRDGDCDVRHLNATSLLNWLRSSGHTTLSAMDIGAAKLSFISFEKELFNGTPSA